MSIQSLFDHKASSPRRSYPQPIRPARPALQVAIASLTLLLCTPLDSIVADEAQLLKQTCNGTTIAIVRIDSKELALPPQLSQIADEDASRTIADWTQSFAKPIEQIRELLQNQVAYFAVDLPYSPQVNARLHTSTNVPENQLVSLAQVVWPFEVGVAQRNAEWRTVPLATVNAISPEALWNAELLPSQFDSWQLAMQETASFPVQLAVVYPKYLRDTFGEIDPELPSMLGGGSAKTMISGVEWISLGVSPSKMKLRLVVQTTDVKAAEAIQVHMPKLFRALLKEGKIDPTLSTMVMEALRLLKPEVLGQKLVLSLENPEQTETVLKLAISSVNAIAEPIAASKSQNQLKQLVLGIHNFVDAHRMLPTYDWLKKHEKPSGLSWRVHLLPYVGEVELYNQFKLDEPWDSAHNIKLLEKMPSIYQPNIPTGSTETVKHYHTTFAAPLGEKTVFGQNKPIGFQHILDGTSNTIVIVELQPEHAIPWTSPEEYRYDKAAPTSKLRSINGRINAALLDGSVHGFRDDVPAATWNALFTIDGGEVVRLP